MPFTLSNNVSAKKVIIISKLRFSEKNLHSKHIKEYASYYYVQNREQITL